VKVIFVLGKDKDGKPKEITLRIIGQRAAIPDSSLLRQDKGGLQATRAVFSSQNL
jgi:hypothetical protein